MNNYSPMQKFLHRLALSSMLIRETMFDIEQKIFVKDIDVGKHIFITGLARSGTTILLNSLHSSNEFASLSYDDMPFILAPNFWTKITPFKTHDKNMERAHNDGIIVSTDSPEAFEEVFWMTFNDYEDSTIIKFEKYIKSVLYKNNLSRYLSKNNQNIRRLKLISNSFPDSIVLIPFRHPLQHSNSLFFQHTKFIDESIKDPFIKEYMQLIGHTEFGPCYEELESINLKYDNPSELDHWLEQWLLSYHAIMEIAHEQRNIYLVCYESLCSDKSTWQNLKKLVDLDEKTNYQFKESIKQIESSYDQALFDDCLDLYEKLRSNTRI